MKKLMLAAAIVCAAAITQAAAINWSSEYLNVAGAKGDGPYFTDATVYLINGSAETFYNNVVASGFSSAIASASVIDSATQGESKLSSPTSGTMSGSKDVVTVDAGAYTLFMTAIDAKGNLYISEGVSASVTTVGSKNASYTHDAAYEGTTYELKASNYQGAAWYTVTGPEPTPEPTSGLLLILGMAGLALRRKHA